MVCGSSGSYCESVFLCCLHSTSVDNKFLVAQEDLVAIAEHSKDYMETDNQMATKL